jgi:CRP/FNR family transcriptional regulator, cyclic AMP receptor protein
MNGHSKRIATTTAIEDCLITAITKAAMITALHDEPAFSELFMAYLLTRNSRIEEDLIDQLFNSSEKRLARLRLLLANFGKDGTPRLISPNVSQETLAEMIGTTRSLRPTRCPPSCAGHFLRHAQMKRPSARIGLYSNCRKVLPIAERLC